MMGYQVIKVLYRLVGLCAVWTSWRPQLDDSISSFRLIVIQDFASRLWPFYST